MKKTFTKLFSAALITAITLTGLTAAAQTTSLNNDAANVAATTTTASTDIKAETKTEEKAAAKAKADAAADKKMAAKVAADPDTAWKPQRRVWGYSFGDFYYDQHSDAGGRGSETNYSGVPTYRNAFQLRRIYLGYDYEITKKFKAELLLASEPNASTGVVGVTSTSTSTTTITGAAGVTGKTTTTTTSVTTLSNGDNTVDNKMAFFIKNINLRYREIFPGTDFVIGEMATPTFALNEPGTNGPTTLSESVWGYRSVERTITDFHKANSYDLGASLQGTFDPAKTFGYVLMVGNNSTASLLGAANPNTGFYKIFYGDIWGKFLNNHLDVDIYADYLKTAAATYAIGPQSHNMFKVFAAYVSKPLSVGVEAYTQKISEGVTNSTTKLPEDATVHGLTIWVKGAIVKDKLGFFARRDGYNPDTQFATGDSYSVNTNYGSYTPTIKETFYTAGLDFTPTKNVHFMPNMWLVDYKDQRHPSTTGYVAPDHTLVYRLTFFYTFGK